MEVVKQPYIAAVTTCLFILLKFVVDEHPPLHTAPHGHTLSSLLLVVAYYIVIQHFRDCIYME